MTSNIEDSYRESFIAFITLTFEIGWSIMTLVAVPIKHAAPKVDVFGGRDR